MDCSCCCAPEPPRTGSALCPTQPVPKARNDLCYIQPEIPKSYKPDRRYNPSDIPSENNTIYRMSYLGHCAGAFKYAKSTQLKPMNNLSISGKFSDCTTQKHDYRCHAQTEPASPIIHPAHKMIGDGPMQCLTTARHDYVPKPYSKAELIIPPRERIISDEPLEGRTIMSLSYQPPCNIDQVASYKPIRAYRQPDQPFVGDTIQKLSYMPVPIIPKENCPWAAARKYTVPSIRFEDRTIYNSSYLPNCTSVRRGLLKPAHGNLIPESAKFAQATIYKESYQPICETAGLRRSPLKVADSLIPPSGKFGGSTTHQHDFRQPPKHGRSLPIIPPNSIAISQEALSGMTTQKHDYPPKPITKTVPIIPPHEVICSDLPLEDKTIMSLSYQPPCNMEPSQSYKPIRVYQPPQSPFVDATIQKMSYVPIPLFEKEKFPWAVKQKFRCPAEPMADRTVYNMSYFPPGKFVPCGNGTNTKCDCVPERSKETICKATCFDPACCGATCTCCS